MRYHNPRSDKQTATPNNNPPSATPPYSACRLFCGAFAAQFRSDADARGAVVVAAAFEAALRRLLAVLRQLGVKEESYINVAMSDGEEAIACRYTTEADYEGESLWLHTGRIYVCVKGQCRMLAPERGRGCVLVSSEPLSDDPGWDPIPRNSLVLVHADGRTETRPLQVG